MSISRPGKPLALAVESVALGSVSVLLLLLLLLTGVRSDYENTWNFYYEQPCCGGSSNGQHHLRHHRVETRAATLCLLYPV
ncbi:AAEL005996-PA [Aedes aegypti]|uniref:AAEL005996-PA n=1 Tax=Aedes aegypti TaxID=7159 RepID=Q177X7_AEDAE|nr:AAEL005996-PA [Aedes aegypti]